MRHVLFSNLWLFAPLVTAQMDKAPSTAAMLRTTIAPTMLEGSIKENVLPMRARGVVNFRLQPGMSSDELIRRVESIVDDARVKIVVTGTSRSEPSPVSGVDTDAFARLHRAVKATFAEAVVAPSLVLGATDTRHFTAISDNLLRFLPVDGKVLLIDLRRDGLRRQLDHDRGRRRIVRRRDRRLAHGPCHGADMRKQGVIVGIVAPGVADTDMLKEFGYKGPLTVSAETAVAGMIKVIASLTPDMVKKPINYDGKQFEW